MEQYWICATCANQAGVKTSSPAPEVCIICEDDRQPPQKPGSRQWTCAEDIGAEYKNDVKELEPGLWGIGLEPSFGIGQRSLFLRTGDGNILFDCIPYLDEATKELLHEAGGVRIVTASHPHFYSAMVDIAEEFGASILVPEKDKHWVQRGHDSVNFWSGDELKLTKDATLVRLGGHFPGSSVLHWRAQDGKHVIGTGDTLQVTSDGFVSVMYSYPCLLPLPAKEVERMRQTLRKIEFDRLYGGWWGKTVLKDAHAVVQKSADRYLAILNGTDDREYF